VGNGVRHTQLLGHQQQECKSNMGEGAAHGYYRKDKDCIRKGSRRQAPCHWINSGATVYLNSENTGLGKHCIARTIAMNWPSVPLKGAALPCSRTSTRIPWRDARTIGAAANDDDIEGTMAQCSP
jgi:hypothetical protein